MTKEEIDKQLEASVKSQLDSVIRCAKNNEKDKDAIYKLHALLKAARNEEPDMLNSTYAYIRGCLNFDFMKNLMEAGELLDLPLEKWKTTDYPESKNRDFTFTLPSGSSFHICVYLSDDAECRLVEVSRKTEEKVEYRMECGREETS